ncbi:MAG: hypothetical protein M0Z39_03130, partial [Actinomycetota bacterium]|nr:hypothetical protein [Actinomycetota bacterium]
LAAGLGPLWGGRRTQRDTAREISNDRPQRPNEASTPQRISAMSMNRWFSEIPFCKGGGELKSKEITMRWSRDTTSGVAVPKSSE